jgi:hypothetical protein
MKIRTKKLINNKVIRVASQGELKEVFIEEDIMKKESAKIQLCFKGDMQSGIIELNSEEIDTLYKELKSNKEMLQGVKVLKFEK